uniref:Rapamycin-insensitive companion of mTOR n=1 Tax=Schistocephalus solidus TaxID=70667 RepID=A0A0X3P594_SCHSO
MRPETGFTSPSVERLVGDLQQEPLKLAETLLRQCLTDFSPVFACRDPLSGVSCKKEATNQDKGVSDYEACPNSHFLGLCQVIVTRLNVLVLLSRSVFTRLRHAAPRLRRVFLVAVYRVLSLALCNGQRSVRCAGIRCLRHYVRSDGDVDLLLANRLDLFITRCFDLSYESSLPTAESSECSRQKIARANPSSPSQLPQQMILDYQLPTLFGNRLIRPAFRRRILPGNRLPRSASEDRTDMLRFAPAVTTKTSLQDCVSNVTIGHISASSERLQVLKLAYHILRLAPRNFPTALVQALVSSCLTPLQGATASSVVDRVMGAGNVLAAVNVNNRSGVPTHPPPAEAPALLPVSRTASKYEAVADDPHIHACLLILVEFVLSQSSRGPSTPPFTAAKTSSSCPSPFHHQTLLALRNCAKCIQHVFFSDPASCENIKHPVLMLETLLLVLINLADGALGRRLIGSDVFQKFLVPFTTGFPLVSIPRSAFDIYPDIITFSMSAVILLLRSWPGIFYFLSREGQKCLCTMTHSLNIGSSKLRLRILCLLYSLLPGIPFPHLSTTAVGTVTQQLLQQRKFQQQYQLDASHLVRALRTALPNAIPEPFPNLDSDFVVDEGCRLFGRPRHRLCASFGGGGTSLIEAHTSLLVCLLTNAGLLEGLVSAAGDTNPLASSAAAQLLGFLAYKSSTLLPQEHPCSQRLRSLIIFNQVSQSSRLTVDKISRVHAALEDFDKYTSILKICAPLHSPFLEQLACQSRTNDNTNGLCPRASPSGAFRSVSASPEASIHTTSGLSPVVVPLRRRHPPSASAKAATTVLKPLDDLLENVFVQSRVIIQSTPLHPASSKISYRRLTFAVSQKPYSWNWDVLATWARSLCAVNKPLSWKTPLRQAFLRRLFDFLTPDILLLSLPIHTIASTASSLSTPLPGNTQSTGSPLSPFYASLLHHKRSKNLTNDIVCIPNLAWTFQSWTEAWAAGILLGGLLQHLSLYPADSLPGQLLRQFLQSIHQCLLATLTFEEQMDVHAGVTAGTPVSNLHHLFQPVALKIFCSPLLLFAVGRFSSCEAGYELLTSMGLTEAIFQLLEQPTTSGVHRPLEVKINLNRQTLLLLKILLASSSFASNEGFGQRLLASAFRYGTESVRLFAVKFIRLILRMGLRADPEICISFLLRSLLDSSNPVVEEAIDVLEEACEVGGSNLQVINEYCNGSGDPAVLMMVTKKFGDHMTSGAAMGIEKCRLLNLPLLLLTPEAGLAGHRIFASLLSTPSVFHRFLEFPSIPPASNLVYWMLSAWRQVTACLQVY